LMKFLDKIPGLNVIETKSNEDMNKSNPELNHINKHQQ